MTAICLVKSDTQLQVSDCDRYNCKNNLFNQIGALMKKIFTCYWTRKVGILFFVVVLLMMAGMVGVGLLNAQKG